jgi:hypothetical protein
MSINQVLSPSTTRVDINGNPGIAVIRDYQHAARIFVDGNYALSPKYDFLFYVEFVFDPTISQVDAQSNQELGMIVKSVDLPKFTIDLKSHNAYNRKNISQHKISYDPVSIVFHDDQADVVKNFWYDYYSFYFRDSDYTEPAYQTGHKYQPRPAFDWGFTPKPTPKPNSSGQQSIYQYIQAIRIYSLYQKKFSEYELINPSIASFRHGNHANGTSGTLDNTMTVQYEAVKYFSGYTTTSTVGGYIDLHYDNFISPLLNDNYVAANLISDRTNNGNPYLATPNVTDLAVGKQTAGVVSAAGATTPTSATASPQNAQSGAGTAVQTASTQGLSTLGIVAPVALAAGLPIGGALIVGAATRGVATGVTNAINNVASGVLAPSYGANAIAGLALSAALGNPRQVLTTAENMLTRAATGYASTAVTQLTNYVTNTGKSLVASGLDNLNSSVGSSLFNPGTTLTQGIASAAGDLWTNITGTGVQQGVTQNLFGGGLPTQINLPLPTTFGIYSS